MDGFNLADPEYGGMGLPMTVDSGKRNDVAACLSLQLALMTQGQIEALEAHADAQIKSLYLPKRFVNGWVP